MHFKNMLRIHNFKNSHVYLKTHNQPESFAAVYFCVEAVLL